MKNKEKRYSQAALSFLFATAVFITLLLFVGVIAGLGALMSAIGVLPDLKLDISSSGIAIFLVILFSLVIGAGISFFISRLLTKPLDHVIHTMDELASGDYQARLSFGEPLKRHTTVKEVTDSFNRMASELQQTEMLRSDFINNFSHEFKTPIVSIAGFAKLLKKGNLSKEAEAEYLDIIEEESLRLSQMATNVMDLTKVENQTILTDISRFNLSEQIRTCVLMLEGKWSKKHIELSLPSEEYHAEGNEEMLRQVWINLLDNAIKFSPEHGEVEIRITQSENTVNVSFINSGETIPPDKQEKIFSKFYQADESHATEGNGIGLAIVKKIVELHDGEVKVESQKGKTTFTVVLSRKRGNQAGIVKGACPFLSMFVSFQFRKEWYSIAALGKHMGSVLLPGKCRFSRRKTVSLRGLGSRVEPAASPLSFMAETVTLPEELFGTAYAVTSRKRMGSSPSFSDTISLRKQHHPKKGSGGNHEKSPDHHRFLLRSNTGADGKIPY